MNLNTHIYIHIHIYIHTQTYTYIYTHTQIINSTKIIINSNEYYLNITKNIQQLINHNY